MKITKLTKILDIRLHQPEDVRATEIRSNQSLKKIQTGDLPMNVKSS